MANLARMRGKEGDAMAADLADNCRQISDELTQIEARAPLVAEAYRTRISERLQKTLEQYQITLEPTDLIKEVSIFAERSATFPRKPSACEATWNNSINMELRGELGTQARVPDAGNVPRGQHDRLEGQRRADLPACDRYQGGHRADPRNDSERRVSCRRPKRSCHGFDEHETGPIGDRFRALRAPAKPRC